MVARINSSKRLAKALLYNEQKVARGQAECLAAHLFLKAPEQLSFPEKVHYLEWLTTRNQRVVTNTVHLSLNFDKSDGLNREKLVEISKSYMQKIGFGDQPYLVYQHRDSGHPHVHIVSTNIRRDGSRIDLHNIGRMQSEKARQEIEREWGLTQAKGHRLKEVEKFSYAQKVVYGESGTKEAIAAVLQAVYPHYHYTTLEEYNAVLRLYNVAAEQGSATSRMRQGLVYRVVDERGLKIGVPIKASAFDLQPTLKNLETRFRENEGLRQRSRQRLENKIFRALQAHPFRLDGYQKRLEAEGIHVVLPQVRNRAKQGITYVDHVTKSVFHESALDARYWSQGMKQEPLTMAGEKRNVQQQLKPLEGIAHTASRSQGNELVQRLLSPVATTDSLPQALKPSKKKRKRMHHHL